MVTGPIVVFSNPRSRGNLLRPSLSDALREAVRTRGRVFEPEDPETLARAAEDCLALGPAAVAVNGGDGTLHMVLTALEAAGGGAPLPPILPLCGGTMNTVARGAGIVGRPVPLLKRLVADLDRGEPLDLADRQAMRIDGGQLGFLFGIGLIARYLERYYEGGTPTPLKAAKVFAHLVGSALIGGPVAREATRPFAGPITTDGDRWPEVGRIGVALGTVPDIGLGFRPFAGVEDRPGEMRAIGLGCNAFDLARLLPLAWRGEPMVHPLNEDRWCSTLVLEDDQPIPYMVDGDLHHAGTRLEVEAGPRVRFVRPR